MSKKKSEIDLFERKTKSLDEYPIHLAEFEHLYDKNEALRGHIDPNALSAGGFPFILRRVLIQLYADLRNIEPTVDVSDIPYVKEISEILISDFEIEEKIANELTSNLLNLYRVMLLNNINETDYRQLVRSVRLVATKLDCSKTIKDRNKALTKILSTETGLAYLNPKFWIKHRINLIEELYKRSLSGQNIGTFSNEFLKNLIKYIEAYTDAIYLPDQHIINQTKQFNSYDVEWESDLGYAAKRIIEMKCPGVTVNVYCDLHSNTGIVSLIPLNALTAPFGGKKADEIYRLLISGKVKSEGKQLSIILPHKKYPYIEMKTGDNSCSIHFSRDNIANLQGCNRLTDVISESFNQFAYLYEHFPNSELNLQNNSHKKMYLSSVLNAKAALFEIYNHSDVEISYPSTFIDTDKINPVSYAKFLNEGKLVVKEGGWCSTGGSQVDIYVKEDLSGIDDRYLTNVVQPYVPSYLIKHKGIPLHTHVRKISVISNLGRIVHAGYITKSSHVNRTNSSAFKTIVLVFDEEKRFIFGVFVGRESITFHNLVEADIEISLGKEDFHDFLEEVKTNWCRAMYVLNRYCAGDISTRFNKMVDQGIIDRKYYIN